MVPIHHTNLCWVWMDAVVVYASKTFNLINANNHSELLDTNKEQCWQAGWSFKTPNLTKVWLKQKAARCLSPRVLMHQHHFRLSGWRMQADDEASCWAALYLAQQGGPRHLAIRSSTCQRSTYLLTQNSSWLQVHPLPPHTTLVLLPLWRRVQANTCSVFNAQEHLITRLQ